MHRGFHPSTGLVNVMEVTRALEVVLNVRSHPVLKPQTRNRNECLTPAAYFAAECHHLLVTGCIFTI
jgi:hypothetical protein